jgi:uncharacterized protein (DUF362 family)
VKLHAAGEKATIHVARAKDAYEGACEVLDTLGFRVEGRKVFIKPNLTGARPGRDGLTVDTGAVRAVLERLVGCPVVTIGESCSRTDRAFAELGYEDLARGFPNVRLVDMRESEIVWKPIPRPFHTKEMPFAADVFEHDYLVNVAKMKTHSLAGVTLCLKNIFGFVPTRRQKLMYHPFIRRAVLDINQVVRSDFCLVEGIWGNEFDEIRSTPVETGVVIGGESFLAVDRVAAAVMGIDADSIDTYRMAAELFGRPEVVVRGHAVDEVRREYRRGCLFTTRLRYLKEGFQSLCYRAACRH